MNSTPATPVSPAANLIARTREEQERVLRYFTPDMDVIGAICRKYPLYEHEECVQDVSVRLIEYRGELPPENKRRAWLARVTQRRCIGHYRAARCRGLTARVALPDGYDIPDTSAGYAAQEMDDQMDLAEAIRHLPLGLRCVVKLWLKGHTARETAKELGISARQVKSRIAKILRKLRVQLAYRDEEGGVS